MTDTAESTERSECEGIIVIGTPRSGTTLLRRLLDAHPHIACPGETGIFSACARFLSSNSIAEDVELGVLNGLSYTGFSEQQVLERLRELAFSFPREHARRQGKARWAEKTAFDAFYLTDIERLCGEHAHFICLQRHGLDVACSLVELCDKNGGYLPELHEYIKRYPRPLEAFAHVWLDQTESIHNFVQRHSDTALLIRYEDLVAKPEVTLQRICEVVGEDWPVDWIAKAMGRRENVGFGDWKTYATSSIEDRSIGRWRALSSATISSLGKIVNPTLARCGYEPVPTQADRDSETARHRYELGLMMNALRNEAQTKDR